jgi:lysophospholipase L1-like esterase
MKEGTKKHDVNVRIISFLIIILLTGIIIEGMARLAFHFQDQIRVELTKINPAFGWQEYLNEYQVLDLQYPGHWRLRSGFTQTLEQLIVSKKRLGHVLGGRYFEERAEKLDIPEDEIVIRINQSGFRGLEIDKSHSRLRILTIGDSVTFGTFEKYSYPRVMEEELDRMGIEVEVINGGIEGHRPRDALLRIEEFKTLRPEIVTIFIGWNELFSWNALFTENEVYEGPERYFHSLRILKRVHLKLADSQEEALAVHNRELHPDLNAPLVEYLKEYEPPFIGDVEQIVKEMQSVGSRVVLVTLPGLFVMWEEPSEQALKAGYVPPFTDNPYVVARMTEQYNIALRELAEQYGLQVIDLEEWSKTALQPRDTYFYDSVHPYEEGQELIGVYMAEQLFPFLKKEDVNANR